MKDFEKKNMVGNIINFADGTGTRFYEKVFDSFEFFNGLR